jgi:hypothetical protein
LDEKGGTDENSIPNFKRKFLKRRCHFGDLGVDGRIISKLI